MPAAKSPSLPHRLALGIALLTLGAAGHAQAKPKAKKPPVATTDSAAASGQDSDAASSHANHAVPEPEAPAEGQPSAAPQPTAAKQPASPTPAAPETQSGAAHASDAANEKLAVLRADVTSLMDDMVEARSRAAMLGKTLFKTQVRVRVQNLAAPDPVLVKIVLKLDGAPIYRGDAAALSGDDAHQVFQSFIAPGAHVLSAEIEQRSRDDAAYGYVLHETYRFQALREKRSELTLILDDDSDLASDFPDDGSGEYDVRTKLRVKSKNLNEE
jgi:hypothetical protein